ncbi:MAG: type II secretion system protein M [Candidatus Competibacteraceae bacterium]|nr:type II secretion system protein M [Candidatus Competibacteraceae bacterium]MCB1814347.1 type II secretion system protein M [Candidatus Competibacteraceae bacterium]
MREQLREWWQQRNPREQLILLGSTLLLLTLLLYVSLWEPLQTSLHRARAQVTQLRDDLHWMQTAAARLQNNPRVSSPTAPAGTTRSGNSIASHIDQSARQAGLSDYVQRIDARDREDVQIVFEAVPFDALVRWLDQLTQSDVEVGQISIDSARQPGLVNARIVLRRQTAQRA